MPRTLVLAVLAAAAVVAAAAAQGPPTFVPKPHVARFVVEDVAGMLTRLPDTAIGTVLAEPDVAAAFATALTDYRRRAARRDALLAAVRATKVDVEPWVLVNLSQLDAWRAVRMIDLADTQRLSLVGLLDDGEDRGDGRGHRGAPLAVATLTCLPRAEGRWTALFERQAQTMAADPFWRAVPDSKFAGFPAYVFTADLGAPDTPPPEGIEPKRAWLLHLPGLFAFGERDPDTCGTFAPPPAAGPARFEMDIDLRAYVAMFERNLGIVMNEVRALGAHTATALRWRVQFAGPLLLDEWEVEVDEPEGLVKALLGGTATLPPQALPDGALAQVRCAIDLPTFLTTLLAAGGADTIPEPIATRAAKAFTGGIALGVAAPAPGGMIPRLFLSLGVADDRALDDLLAAIPAAVARKAVTYDDVPCTVLTLPDMPPALQPAFCRRSGVLHVAESGTSLRAFLRAQRDATAAMDVGDAPLPAGKGDVLASLDIRCDEAALYRAFHTFWLPLLKLIPGDDLKPLLGENDMPEPEAVMPLLGKSRGVLRRDGNRYTVQQLGRLGGLELAALAMTWGPLLSSLYHDDSVVERLELDFARHQLQAAWTAFDAFQKANQRLPKDLTELFVAQQLPADALLLPGDPDAEPVPMPAGDPRAPRSSYRYFATPATAAIEGTDTRLILIGVAPRRYNRPMLAADGSLPNVWGDVSQWPIARFGK